MSSARFPVVCITMILGAVVYRWTSEMVSSVGRLLALALFVPNANIVAHTRILSTGLRAACVWRLDHSFSDGDARFALSGFSG